MSTSNLLRGAALSLALLGPAAAVLPAVGQTATDARFRVEPASGEYEALARANLRQEPGAQGRRVALLNAGERVRVTGKVAGLPWLVVVRADGQTGFVQSDLLRALPAAAAEPAAPVRETVEQRLETLKADVARIAEAADRGLGSSRSVETAVAALAAEQQRIASVLAALQADQPDPTVLATLVERLDGLAAQVRDVREAQAAAAERRTVEDSVAALRTDLAGLGSGAAEQARLLAERLEALDGRLQTLEREAAARAEAQQDALGRLTGEFSERQDATAAALRSDLAAGLGTIGSGAAEQARLLAERLEALDGRLQSVEREAAAHAQVQQDAIGRLAGELLDRQAPALAALRSDLAAGLADIGRGTADAAQRLAEQVDRLNERVDALARQTLGGLERQQAAVAGLAGKLAERDASPPAPPAPVPPAPAAPAPATPDYGPAMAKMTELVQALADRQAGVEQTLEQLRADVAGAGSGIAAAVAGRFDDLAGGVREAQARILAGIAGQTTQLDTLNRQMESQRQPAAAADASWTGALWSTAVGAWNGLLSMLGWGAERPPADVRGQPVR